MSKYVSPTHVTSEKGVLKFATYCAKHSPYIIFREETKHDYGIDGEIEITRKTTSGKIEASAQIVKIQLKATKEKGYIGKETSNSFEFIAKDSDLQYWSEHSSEVVLVVYFENEDLLYAKRVDKNYVIKGRKTHKILFDKDKNMLSDDSNFENVVKAKFKNRVNYDKNETLHLNLLPIHLPQYINLYQSKFTDVQKIFDVINENDLYPVPKFSLESNKLYSLELLENYNSILRDNILDNSLSKKIPLHQFVREGQVQKNIVVKILNRYLKDFFGKKGIYYNPKHKRYYFANFKDAPLKIDKKATSTREVYRYEKSKGKSGRSDKRAVVSKYIYYETTYFYRHFAFQTSFEWIDTNLFLILDPKYFFTYDGNNLLDDPDRISKLTNKIKLTEHNSQYLNHLYFLRNFLDRRELNLFFEDTLNRCHIHKLKKVEVNFGISEKSTKTVKKGVQADINQISLFE